MGLQPASIRPLAMVVCMHVLLLLCMLWAISPKPWSGQVAQSAHSALEGTLLLPATLPALRGHAATNPARTPQARSLAPSVVHAPPTAPQVPAVSTVSTVTAPAVVPSVPSAAESSSTASNTSSTTSATNTRPQPQVSGEGLDSSPAGSVATPVGEAQPREGYPGGTTTPPNSFLAELLRRLARHKVYPAELKQQKVEGRVVLTFTLDAQGGVTKAGVTRSSGHLALDQAALSMLQAASPLPPIPPSMNRQFLTLSVPIEYSLIRDR